jgi:hypothetical protein
MSAQSVRGGLAGWALAVPQVEESFAEGDGVLRQSIAEAV